MSNSPTCRTKRRRVRSPWDIYDALPVPIRAALQEGPVQWNVGIIAARYRRWRREEGETEAIVHSVWIINRWNLTEIWQARPWQPPGWGRRKPKPSPHIAAKATMQTGGRVVQRETVA
jgi:Family of unknown function (DUF6525)